VPKFRDTEDTNINIRIRRKKAIQFDKSNNQRDDDQKADFEKFTATAKKSIKTKIKITKEQFQHLIRGNLN
jgi:hypothetical protein